jgi:hypothetical protein
MLLVMRRPTSGSLDPEVGLLMTRKLAGGTESSAGHSKVLLDQSRSGCQGKPLSAGQTIFDLPEAGLLIAGLMGGIPIAGLWVAGRLVAGLMEPMVVRGL